MPARHLVTVWNPAYAADAMEVHQRILRAAAEACREKTCDEDDVYVWWAKLRSSNRLQPLPHLDEILAIGAEQCGDEPDAETHLYLTDYRTLYVAHVAEITADDPRKDPAERARIPAYYLADGRVADFWFRLWDIRRLVQDDTESVIHDLQQLRNVRYEDKPVSIYGGMVDLPLIVTEPEPVQYFDEATRAQVTGGVYWVEWEAGQAGGGRLARDLRQNLFGDEAWHRLDPATRTFVVTAERIFRDSVDDPALDLAPSLVELSKALEVTCARVLRPVLAKAPRQVRDGLRAEDLPEAWAAHPRTLADCARILGSPKAMADYLGRTLRDGRWLAESLGPVLADFARYRNPAAHEAVAGRADVIRWRGGTRSRARSCGRRNSRIDWRSGSAGATASSASGARGCWAGWRRRSAFAKADLLLRRGGRVQHRSDRLDDRLQLVVVSADPPLQLHESARQLRLAHHPFSQPQERPHHEDAHLDGPGAVQDRREHYGAVLCERVREISRPAPSPL